MPVVAACICFIAWSQHGESLRSLLFRTLLILQLRTGFSQNASGLGRLQQSRLEDCFLHPKSLDGDCDKADHAARSGFVKCLLATWKILMSPLAMVNEGMSACGQSKSMPQLRARMLEMLATKDTAMQTHPAPLLIVNGTQHNFKNLDMDQRQDGGEFHLFEITVRARIACNSVWALNDCIVSECWCFVQLYFVYLDLCDRSMMTVVCCVAIPLRVKRNRLSRF